MLLRGEAWGRTKSSIEHLLQLLEHTELFVLPYLTDILCALYCIAYVYV